ncbi:hypothetical protein WDU94_010731 [Cyamophila willieti]
MVENHLLYAVKIVYMFATLTCHRCCYYVGENVRYRFWFYGLAIRPKSGKISLTVAFIKKCIRLLSVHF